MRDDLGPRPSFTGTADYHGIWYAQANRRDSRADLLSESGDDPDALRQMPYALYLKTGHWEAVRRRSLAIAENRCFYCGASDRLDVHHLSYKRLGCELDEDLIVLCRTCHGVEHGR